MLPYITLIPLHQAMPTSFSTVEPITVDPPSIQHGQMFDLSVYIIIVGSILIWIMWAILKCLHRAVAPLPNANMDTFNLQVLAQNNQVHKRTQYQFPKKSDV